MNLEFSFDQFIKIVKYYSGDTTVVLQPMLQSIADNEKIKTIQYFENVLDQPVFFSDDYLRLRRLFIDWFAAYKSLLFFHKNLSDIKYINKELLLESFGYFFHYLNNESTKEFLCYNLNRLYSYKGTPTTVMTILESTNILGFKLFEYWLAEVDGELIFQPKAAFTENQLNSNEISTYSLPYHDVVDSDPHWQYTESDILSLNQTESLGLPSMTPYFGLLKIVNWFSETRKALAKVKRTIREQLLIYADTGETPKELYFDLTDQTISLIELYCAWVSAYYLHYQLDDTLEKDSNDKLCEITLPDEVVYDNALYIDEFDRHYTSRTYDRSERETLLNERLTDWFTDEYPFKTARDYQDTLQLLNPVLYNFIINNSGDFKVLSRLIEYVEYYIQLYWDISAPLHYAIFDDEIDENIYSLINFFKPYPSRLIIFDTMFVINDLPGDIAIINEDIEEDFLCIFDQVCGFGRKSLPLYPLQSPLGERPPMEPASGNHHMLDFMIRDRIENELIIDITDMISFEDGNKYTTNNLNDIYVFDIAELESVENIDDNYTKLRDSTQVKKDMGGNRFVYISNCEDFYIQVEDF